MITALVKSIHILDDRSLVRLTYTNFDIGTCSQSFTTCNDNFYNCNITTCNAKYSSGFGSSILRYGCIKAGEAYAAAVGTQPGKDAFESSTNLHCICV